MSGFWQNAIKKRVKFFDVFARHNRAHIYKKLGAGGNALYNRSMKDFKFYSPSEILFGRGVELKAGEMARKHGATKALVHFGGKSAKESGLLDRVCAGLSECGIKYETLGGVQPNPRVSKVREGVKLCRDSGVDFILAVGGGSVIDSAKGIALGLPYEGDVWDFYCGKAKPESVAPFGAVLTVAAAGSEMSDASVLTNDDGSLKRGFSSEMLHCSFSLLNPELTFTLPAYQTACGCADMIIHNLERYFSPAPNLDVTDEISEAVMRVVVKNARILMSNPRDYDARAEVMWCGTLSHNDVTGSRYNGDWASHQLEHELSGMYDIAHGAGLSAIWGAWARYVLSENPSRFARLGEKVFTIPHFEDPVAGANKTIEKFEEFFRSLRLPTSLAEAGIFPDEKILAEMSEKCTFFGKRKIGAFKKLDGNDILKIYRSALR